MEMDSISLKRFRGIFWLFLFANAMLICIFTIALFAPVLTAADRLPLPYWILSAVGFPQLFLGIAAISLICARASKKNAPGFMVTAVVTTVLLFVYFFGFSRSQRERWFLSTFAARVDKEIGTTKLLAFAQRVEDDIRKQRRVTTLLETKDLPIELANLYKRTPPRGNVSFDANGTVLHIEILWGGPLYRWGVKVLPDGDTLGLTDRPHSLSLSINSNIRCFVVH